MDSITLIKRGCAAGLFVLLAACAPLHPGGYGGVNPRETEIAGDRHPAVVPAVVSTVRSPESQSQSASSGTVPQGIGGTSPSAQAIYANQNAQPAPQTVYVVRESYPCSALNGGTLWGGLAGAWFGSWFGRGHGRGFFTLMGATLGAVEGNRQLGCR